MDASIDYLPTATVTFDGQHLVYFIEREKFREELKQKDDEFCYNMLNNFIKIYQVCEKDLLVADPDVIGPLKLRQDDLVICSLGVFAHLNWNVERISKGIHSTKFRALLRQLVIFMFPNKSEFLTSSDSDFFGILYEMNFDEFTEETIFAPWICSKWLLFINKLSHFPIVVAKQTVSNPWAIVDPSLIQAEAHGKCVHFASYYTGAAACFMQKMLASKLNKMRIPTAECFLKYNPMNAENLVFWQTEVRPEFGLSNVVIPIKHVKWRTTYDLLVANFSSRHIKSSKTFCNELLKEKVEFDSLPENGSSFIKFDITEIEFYAQALGLGREKLKPSETNYSTKVKTTNSLSATLGIASRKLVLPEEKKNALSILNNQQKSTVTERLRSESLITLINQVELADEPGEPDDPAPPDSEFENFHKSGPSLFSYFAVVNPAILKNVFNDTLDILPRDSFFPNRLLAPQALAECVAKSCAKNFQTKSFIILGKFRQMCLLRQPERCVKLGELLVLMLQRQSTDPFSMLCLTEIVKGRIMRNLMTVLSQPDINAIENHKNFITNCFERMGTRPLFYRIIFPELLNAGLYDDVSQFGRNFRNDHLCIFFALLVEYIKSPSVKTRDDFNKQYMIVLNIVLPEGKKPFTLSDFVETVECIWHPEALRIMLNSTFMFYNYLIKSNDQHYLVQTPQQCSCYTINDTGYPLKESDRTILKNYADNLDTILRSILRQANRFLSTDSMVLRATGDYTFIQGNYKLALYYYTNCILVTFNHLSIPLTCYKPGIDDLFWRKYITCLLEFKYPIEAAITSHLFTQMYEILPLMPKIIENVRESLDPLADCFPYIGDIAVFESISSSLFKYPHYRRLQEKLLSSVITKTFHTGGSKQQHHHESLRRKLQWIRVLCAQIFDLVDV